MNVEILSSPTPESAPARVAVQSSVEADIRTLRDATANESITPGFLAGILQALHDRVPDVPEGLDSLESKVNDNTAAISQTLEMASSALAKAEEALNASSEAPEIEVISDADINNILKQTGITS